MTCESGYVLFDFIYLLVYSFIHSFQFSNFGFGYNCVCVCVFVGVL